MSRPWARSILSYRRGAYALGWGHERLTISFDLREALAEMRADGLLKLEPRPHPYGPSIVPDRASELLKRLHGRVSDRYAAQVNFVTADLGGKGVAELERLASALYVNETRGVTGGVEQRARTLVELKPHISGSDAGAAVEAVDQMMQRSRALVVKGAA